MGITDRKVRIEIQSPQPGEIIISHITGPGPPKLHGDYVIGDWVDMRKRDRKRVVRRAT